MEKPKAVLFGPCVGELYWEAVRFAPLIQYAKLVKYKNQDVTFIVLTREDRYDLYGVYADIVIPLKIAGDYEDKYPNCFELTGFSYEKYHNYAKNFREYYSNTYNVLEHIYPKLDKKQSFNKDQFSRKTMLFKYQPRKLNYDLVEEYLPKNDKHIIIIAPRYRNNFRRNWPYWQEFFNTLYDDQDFFSKFNFILCGKPGEYIPDSKDRFLDMNKIDLQKGSSLVGLLLVILEKAFFTFGSQSAIPNLSLQCDVEALMFGNQKRLHTMTYNINRTPVTFIENKNYDISVVEIYKQFKNVLLKKEKQND